jgi:DNA-binding helix-hairpin-helix protein with protein kinase domain
VPTFQGLSDRTYTLEDNPFASGGEGKIFSVIGDSSIVAKLYHSHLCSEAKGKKLAVLMKAPPEAELLKYFTWPRDVIFDKGRFVGYIMQRLHGNKRLNEMYTFDKRGGMTWKFCLSIASNLTTLVSSIHKRGHVIGDLNPNNIIVDPQSAVVTMVDNDSYHIYNAASGETYRCEVGMAEFLPASLQGINFKTAPLPTFSTDSDLFALAVLIFSLLMNGAHPFACSVKGVSGQSFQPIDNIKKGFYPYADSQTGVSIPKYAPDIDILPATMQNMFRAAFLIAPNVKKPSADDWHQALAELQGHLRICETVPAHMFYENREVCPWCQVNIQMTALVKKVKETVPVNVPPVYPEPLYTPPAPSQPLPPPYTGPTINLPIPGYPPVSPSVLRTGIIYGVIIGIMAYVLLSIFFSFWAFVGAIVVGAMSCWAVLSNGSEYMNAPNSAMFSEYLLYFYKTGSYALGGAAIGLIGFLVCMLVGYFLNTYSSMFR